MSYRIHRNETRFSDAERLAWEFVLPYRYVPIIDTDREKVSALAAFLGKKFSKQALKAAATRIPAPEKGVPHDHAD